MTTTTYSLEEYAEQLLGSAEPAHTQWLAKRLRGAAEPALPGYKVGRCWRATREDVDTAIEILRPTRLGMPDLPQLGGLTRTSRRRLAS
jgi:hypothetical protein